MMGYPDAVTADTSPITKGVEQLQTAAKDRKVQIIAGVALLAFAGGLYLGIKLRGPQDWVPPIDAAPKPCADCAEKAAGSVPQAAPAALRQLTQDEWSELSRVLDAHGIPANGHEWKIDESD